MNNSSLRSKLGQIMVLQAFEEQPGAVSAGSPPVLWLPPCPGRGRAGSGPGARPWLCWWSSRRAGRTSGVLPALQKPQNMKHNPSSQELHRAGAATHHMYQQGTSHQTLPGWFFSAMHRAEQQMPPAGQPWSKQGPAQGSGGSSLTTALPATEAPQWPPAVTASGMF